MNWTAKYCACVGRWPHDGKGYRPPGIADKPGCERAHPPHGKDGRDRRLHRSAGRREPKSHIDALISISVAPADRQYFITMVENQPGVAQCFHVTGSHSFIVKVSCAGIHELEHLINRFQKLGRRAPRSFYRAGGPALYFGCA